MNSGIISIPPTLCRPPNRPKSRNFNPITPKPSNKRLAKPARAQNSQNSNPTTLDHQICNSLLNLHVTPTKQHNNRTQLLGISYLPPLKTYHKKYHCTPFRLDITLAQRTKSHPKKINSPHTHTIIIPFHRPPQLP
jgi:hypothetical protein